MYDAYDHTAIDWLETVVAGNDFRRLFVLLHMPVVPYNARSNWRVLDHPRHAEHRTRLLDLLGKHRAIVLCGHLHEFCLITRRVRTGRFVQLAVSSIVRDEPKDATRFDSIDDYGPDLVEHEPKFSPDDVDERRKLLAAE